MRQRVEDLGRISVLIENLLDANLRVFEDHKCGSRPKDFVDIFEAMPEESRSDLLHDLGYDIDNVRRELGEIQSIALGMDWVNEVKD